MKQRVFAILEVAFIALFIFSCYKLILIITNYSEGDKIYESSEEYFNVSEDNNSPFGLDFDVNIDSLMEINDDVIGWIHIPDTAVSYPLVADDNNDYYLKHTYNKIYSDFGSIFLDYNTKNGSMFGSLKKYKDKSYLEEHPYVYLVFKDSVYKYEIISAFTVETSNDVYSLSFSDGTEFSKWIKKVCESSEAKSPKTDFDNNENVITLSTCTSRTKTERFVVVAELVGTAVK